MRPGRPKKFCLPLSDLRAYLDGVFTMEKSSTVQSHLSQCQQCRSLLMEVRREFVALSEQLPIMGPGTDFMQAMEKLKSDFQQLKREKKYPSDIFMDFMSWSFEAGSVVLDILKKDRLVQAILLIILIALYIKF